LTINGSLFEQTQKEDAKAKLFEMCPALEKATVVDEKETIHPLWILIFGTDCMLFDNVMLREKLKMYVA